MTTRCTLGPTTTPITADGQSAMMARGGEEWAQRRGRLAGATGEEEDVAYPWRMVKGGHRQRIVSFFQPC